MDSLLKEYDDDDSEEILGTSSTDRAVFSGSDPSGSKKSEASPSTNKGFGLRKWRRIPRDFTRRVDGNAAANSATEEVSNPVLSPTTKRRPVYPEKLQKNVAVISDDSSPPPDSSKGLLIAGSETASAQEQNSSSSTASSAAKTMHFDAIPPLAAGSSHDNKNRMLQRVKKPKGDRLKHAQRVYTSSNGNGTRSEASTHRDGENDAQDQKGGGCREIPQGDEVSKSSSTDIRVEMNGSHTHHDLLDEAISDLKTAQEALGKELLMFKELGKDNDPVFEKSRHGIESTDSGIDFVEAEKETLFRKRIEAEVLYLLISSGAVITRKHEEIAGKHNDVRRRRSVVWKYASVLFVQVLLLFAIVSWLVSSQPVRSCKNVLPPT